MKEKRLYLIHNHTNAHEEMLSQWKSENPEREISVVSIEDFVQLHATGEVSKENSGIFFAFDYEHLNLPRFEQMQRFALKGMVAESFISRTASVPSDFKRGSNIFVGPGAIIESGAKVGNNTYLGAGAHVGHGAVVRSSVWLGRRSVVGARATVGMYSVIFDHVVIGDGVAIGAYVFVGRPRFITQDIRERTFEVKEVPGLMTITRPE
jgi:UDP-3-O-[3-hydroxymyristoyl] glucosamine N-acyltransferase